MTKAEKNVLDYIVVCISEFADRHGMHMREAYIYLTRFKGIEFLKEFYDVVVGPVANDTVGLLIRQFTRGMINAEYLKKEFDFGRLTNQYTFHTEKALQYLKKAGVMYDKSTAGND